MKAEILNDNTIEQIRDYWKRINAPVVLRQCPSHPEIFTVYKKPNADRDTANAFVLASTQFNRLERAALAHQMNVRLPDPMPEVVLSRIWGKTL